MDLFIRIRDGQPFEHPIFSDNFCEAFPEIDVENLPPEFARFQRVPPPLVGMFEVLEEPKYQWVDGIVKDVWQIRQMNDAERAEKLNGLGVMAIATCDFLKGVAQQNADNAPSDAAKQAWLDFLAQLNAWTLVDPANPNLPKPPRINADGTVVSNNASGTAPNVIG